MRETLHIRLPALPADGSLPEDTLLSHAVTRQESSISVQVREAPLAEVLALAESRRILLYAPASDVRLLTAAVPARQASKAALAVPFALEEQFAEDVETLHFALAAQPDVQGEWPVAVVSLQHVQGWLAPFRARGLAPEALIPETLALPWLEDGHWTVLAEADHITVRCGATAGFGCPPEDFETFLELAEAGQRRPLRILVGPGVATDFTRLGRVVELLPGLAHPLEALARHYRSALAINLLQGPFAPRQALAREWQAWRLPLALAAGLCGLTVLGNALSAQVLKREVQRQQQANEDRFRALFPTERRVVNLRAQAEQQLAALQGGGGSGLLPLIDAAAQGLRAAPTLQIDGAQFREGALFLSLSGTSLAALDQLKSHFSASHAARLEVQSANSGDGGLQIRIKLSPA